MLIPLYGGIKLNNKIRLGIVGYGNLGKGVKEAIKHNRDMELVAIFTRRDIKTIDVEDNKINVENTAKANQYTDDIDVMILCGGSAKDLPVQGPHFAKMFNTVDSYDNHRKIWEYIKSIDTVSKTNNKTSAVCIGWDPGLFSMNRVLFEAILPNGKTYTFWGPGVSQGHSDAIRRINGVKNAIQYTIPIESAVESILNGETPDLSTRQRHRRECYVVVEEGVDKKEIEEKIINMPDYFKDYDTEVIFVDRDNFEKNHRKMTHGGFVIRNGKTGVEGSHSQIAEFSLKLDSNSEFTANILVSYARAVYRLNREGVVGAKTILDIPLKYISENKLEDLYKKL